jgi:hypothetical protein
MPFLWYHKALRSLDKMNNHKELLMMNVNICLKLFRIFTIWKF